MSPGQQRGPSPQTGPAKSSHRQVTRTTDEGTPEDRQDALDLVEIAMSQGVAIGRQLEREELAERLDCLDATWQTVQRPTWEQRVAERVAASERVAADRPRRALEDAARDAERGAQILRAADRVAGQARCRSCGGQMHPTPSGLCNPRCPSLVRGEYIGDPAKPFTGLRELADELDRRAAALRAALADPIQKGTAA